MRIDIVTLFPAMLEGFLKISMMKRAIESGLVEFNLLNLRDFATGKHRVTDDRPFGGGPGMIMKLVPLCVAVESLLTPSSRVILLSPSGTPFKQSAARRLAEEQQHLILICGHYEGVDERVCEALVHEEISIGDYVLTNGALAAAVISDAVVRLLPGALGGGEAAATAESFSSGLLDYPQYTRPPTFRSMAVPEILLSGDHAAIAAWRREKALERTRARRRDLLEDEEKD